MSAALIDVLRRWQVQEIILTDGRIEVGPELPPEYGMDVLHVYYVPETLKAYATEKKEIKKKSPLFTS